MANGQWLKAYKRMQEYISKQQQIFRPAAQIFPIISNFTYLTPAVADKVEEWQATEDSCSFKFKGFTVALRFEEKIENKHVKITGDGGTIPMDFSFWISISSLALMSLTSSLKLALAVSTLSFSFA